LKAGENCLSLVWTGNLPPVGQSGVSLALRFGCGTILSAVILLFAYRFHPASF